MACVCSSASRGGVLAIVGCCVCNVFNLDGYNNITLGKKGSESSAKFDHVCLSSAASCAAWHCIHAHQPALPPSRAWWYTAVAFMVFDTPVRACRFSAFSALFALLRV